LENLQTLVRNLAIILLLASFLEMLLPSKSMQGFVKLVMGLFVISAILTPLTEFLKMPLEMGIPAWVETAESDLPVLASGNEGSAIGQSAVSEQYQEIIKNQIKAIALGVSGVKSAEVAVELSKEVESLTDQPQITQILIRISSSEIQIKAIEEVVIGEAEMKVREPSSAAVEVREKVAAFMQIPQEGIQVDEK